MKKQYAVNVQLGEAQKRNWAYLHIFFSLLHFWGFGYRSPMQEQWQKIREILENLVEPGPYKVWIAPVQASVEGTTLRLVTVSAFAARRLRDQFEAAIREAAAIVLDCPPEALTLDFVSAAPQPVTPSSLTADSATPAPLAAPTPVLPPAPSAAQQGMLPLELAPMPKARPRFRFSFDDFVVGSSNEMAVAAARDVCKPDGFVETLFVSSAPGLGKTHLAQAVGLALQQEGEGARVGYLTAEELTSRFVQSVRQRDVEGFRDQMRHWDVLLLEDVHFLQGKEKIQEMVLNLVKSLQGRGGRAIFTSTFTPRELSKLDSQLVSHLSAGILAPMERPTLDMRREILQRKARSFQVMLPDEVSELLAGRLSDDIRQLEACLNNLAFKARLLHKRISPEMALEVLQQFAGAESVPDWDGIVALVCKIYGLSLRQLESRSRRQECVMGRNTVFYLARKHTDLSLAEIGDRLNRTHSSVIKGITSLERELARESSKGRQIARALDLIERNAGLTAAPRAV